MKSRTSSALWRRSYRGNCDPATTSGAAVSSAKRSSSEAVLLAAWDWEGTGSPRSPAATIMKRRGKAPRRKTDRSRGDS